MTTKCIIHSQNDAKVVCHHCGQPLCSLTKLPLPRDVRVKKDQLCGYTINDSFFSTPVGGWVEACHCESCLLEQHPEMASVLNRLKAGL